MKEDMERPAPMRREQTWNGVYLVAAASDDGENDNEDEDCDYCGLC